jgi:hypothetical protein
MGVFSFGANPRGSDTISQPDRPAPIRTLNSLSAASVIAHEAIFELHHRLESLGGADDASQALLAESARIATQAFPQATANAQALVRRWDDEVLLNPDGADATLARLESEVRAVTPHLRELLRRARQIAIELRERVIAAAG